MEETYTLPYGRGALSFAMPPGCVATTACLPVVHPTQSAVAEISRALAAPIGSGPVESLVRPGQRVCIISDDITRPTPAGDILRVLIPRLLEAGIHDKDIYIVLALGSHRPMTRDEMTQKLGSDITSQYSVYNSEFQKAEGLLDLGTSHTGARIHVSKNVMDSDVRIGLGNITPHPALGWSGGAKILYPGVTSHNTVVQFHMLQGLAEEVLFGMDECPVRLEVEKWADVIGLDFIVNTIMTPDLRLYKVVAGHPVAAHRQGVRYVKEVCGAPLKYEADVVVVSSYPVDIDYWQATKGYLCAARAAAPGADIVLVTPCPEGVGPHPEYVRHIGDDGARARLEKIQRGQPMEGDLLALCVGACVSTVRQRYRLVTVSDGVTPEEMREAGIDHYPAARLEDAVRDACARHKNPRVLIITHGGETVLYKA